MTLSYQECPYMLEAPETLRTTDIVIAVVARTGTGKTTFINNFAGPLLPSNDSLYACTAFQAVVIPLRGLTGRRLALLEIPGCDHTSMEDREIEVGVKNWLVSRYNRGKFHGVILLHDSSHQDAGTPFLLKHIKKHCRKDVCAHLMLAITRYGKGCENIAANGAWKGLIDKGATIFRLANTTESALELVTALLAKDKNVSDAERLGLRERKANPVSQMPPSPSPGVSIADTTITSAPSRDLHHSDETNSSMSDHSLMEEEDTIIIALMGASGTGKSSFINKVMGDSVAFVSDSVESCTQDVQAFTCRHPDRSGRNIVLIDTPGFDDSKRTDIEILNIITQWLTKSYKQRIKLTGIIQLYSIADPRMRGTPLKNLNTFEQLCGSHVLKNVILATTFWDQVTADTGLERETQLKSGFWAEMIQHGCRVARFDPWTYQSAWNIINLFDTTASQRCPLRVQIEMVDQRKSLNRTSAFKTLVKSLVQAVNHVRAKIPRSRR